MKKKLEKFIRGDDDESRKALLATLPSERTVSDDKLFIHFQHLNMLAVRKLSELASSGELTSDADGSFAIPSAYNPGEEKEPSSQAMQTNTLADVVFLKACIDSMLTHHIINGLKFELGKHYINSERGDATNAVMLETIEKKLELVERLSSEIFVRQQLGVLNEFLEQQKLLVNTYNDISHDEQEGGITMGESSSMTSPRISLIFSGQAPFYLKGRDAARHLDAKGNSVYLKTSVTSDEETISVEARETNKPSAFVRLKMKVSDFK